MIRRTLIRGTGLILAGLLMSPADAADTWRPEDTARQVAFTALMVADWRQTRAIAVTPGYYETNIVLGERPNASRVNGYFAGTLLAHTLIAHALPHPWRERWQSAGIVIQAGAVTRNDAIGLPGGIRVGAQFHWQF